MGCSSRTRCWTEEGYSYQVIPQVGRHARFVPSDINKMYVRNDENAFIPLDNLVSIDESVSPQTLDQFQQLRSATI